MVYFILFFIYGLVCVIIIVTSTAVSIDFLSGYLIGILDTGNGQKFCRHVVEVLTSPLCDSSCKDQSCLQRSCELKGTNGPMQ